MNTKEMLIAYLFVGILGVTTISSIIYSVIGLRRMLKSKKA